MQNFNISACASIGAGCPVRCTVSSSNDMVFVFGSGRDEFEFFFQAEALRHFIEQATKALAEMDALADKEEAERAKLDQAAGLSA
jgi:hypothetical protein